MSPSDLSLLLPLVLPAVDYMVVFSDAGFARQKLAGMKKQADGAMEKVG